MDRGRVTHRFTADQLHGFLTDAYDNGFDAGFKRAVDWALTRYGDGPVARELVVALAYSAVQYDSPATVSDDDGGLYAALEVAFDIGHQERLAERFAASLDEWDRAGA